MQMLYANDAKYFENYLIRNLIKIENPDASIGAPTLRRGWKLEIT